MAYRDIKKRLERLETPDAGEFNDVLELIKKGACYDDLTDEQRSRYAEYFNVSRVTLEMINDFICDDNTEPLSWRKMPLERKTRPVPKARQEEYIKMRAEEIEIYLEFYDLQLEQDEAQAINNKYDEICEQREAAFWARKSWQEFSFPLAEWGLIKSPN